MKIGIPGKRPPLEALGWLGATSKYSMRDPNGTNNGSHFSRDASTRRVKKFLRELLEEMKLPKDETQGARAPLGLSAPADIGVFWAFKGTCRLPS